MKTIKTTLVAALLLFTVNAALAQEDYQYAVITQLVYKVGISINGTEYKEIDVPKEEARQLINMNTALKQVNKMESEGWEVFNTGTPSNAGSPIYVFYLRKKVS